MQQQQECVGLVLTVHIVEEAWPCVRRVVLVVVHEADHTRPVRVDVVAHAIRVED